MLVYQAKLQETEAQYRVIDEMIRTGLFVRNKCLRYWMDNRGVNGMVPNKYCKFIADNHEFPWVKKLNSMARQAMSERVWQVLSNFCSNCKNKTPGLKGYLKFKKLQTSASFEYKKKCSWKLSSDRKYIAFIDGFAAVTFKLWGTFGKIFGVPVIEVPPDNTSQNCSNCRQKVKQCLSTRTHKCPDCEYIADRDYNAAIIIVKKAVEIIAQLSSDNAPDKYHHELLSAVAGLSHSHLLPYIGLITIAISTETHAGIKSSFTNKPLLSAAVLL
ncbi:transposase [Argonema antarcticum]|uniref:transposase n=1 Tax=Argonema antarcticum TaxID=2942763 RepID=UPI0020121BC3|nr:transposase [Argonema antarcticum]MCL1475673.1 transposase [Argonema antarcticum A004/B2]